MLNLILVLHCHQPIGNFEHIFEMAHTKCYGPLLEILESHPAVKVGLHFSGPLLEWFDTKRPESQEILNRLVQRGQVEPLSGGFFEPLLASIPVPDARGQVRRMNDYLMHRFGRRPTGFWLTERVWDPDLPRTLAGTEMRYTVVDDTHFYYAGLKPEEIYGRYVTEKDGHTMSLLATPMRMRYLIPFRQVEEVMGHLRWLEETGRTVVVYGDDGEKFGLWPGTHEWVIQKGWLEKFFTALADSADWLQTILPEDFLESSKSLGRLYLPQASYEEMTEWALPPEQGKALEDIIRSLKDEGRWETWRSFVRGGIWDNFLVKYDEANRMHKKMLFLSGKVSQNGKLRDFVWRGQCNCAYWHGVFGGLYLGHLRQAVHQNLMRAQAGLIAHSGEALQMMKVDFDKDGGEEILLWNRRMSVGLAPGKGGGMFEICDLERILDLSDTLTRRPEAYHRKLHEMLANDDSPQEGVASIHDLKQIRDEGLEQSLIYDRYTRISLLDHFLPTETAVQDYAVSRYEELGDFVESEFRVEKASISSQKATVGMTRTGWVLGREVTIEKSVRFGTDKRLTVAYEFQCAKKNSIRTRYGCEFNLTLFSDQDQERSLLAPEHGRRREVYETGQEDNVKRFELINRSDGLTAAFSFSRAVTVWFFPLLTVSQSETGFERTYQGSSLLFLIPLILEPGQKSSFQLELDLIKI